LIFCAHIACGGLLLKIQNLFGFAERRGNMIVAETWISSLLCLHIIFLHHV